MIPDLDPRTWIIVVLAAALLICVLAVPSLRENLASWLVWLGVLLGAGAQETATRKARRSDPEPDPETAADELEEGTAEKVDQEKVPSPDELAEDLNELSDDA